MNVFPKFLFLFHCILLFLPNPVFFFFFFFKSFDQIVTPFLWNGKVPRIRKVLLQNCKLQFYFWSANIHKIMYWFISSNALWCRLEPKSCLSTSLQALLTAPLPINLSIFTDNLVVISTFRIWSQFRRYFKFISAFSLMALFMNHSFPPSVTDPVFVM